MPPTSSRSRRPLWTVVLLGVGVVAVIALWPRDQPPAPKPETSASPVAVVTRAELPREKETVPAPSRSNEDARIAALVRLARERQPGDGAFVRELERLAENPQDAVLIGRRLMAECPDQAADIGTILVGALVRGGAYESALELAQDGPSANRPEWIAMTLSNWTQSRPQDAELISDVLREKNVTPELFGSVVKSWASTTPAQAGRYAASLPPGPYRNAALQTVVDPWILQDPAGVASWWPQLADQAERDQALSRLIARTDSVFRPTEQALAWSELIRDPDLKRTALAAVVREWFAKNPEAAKRYVESSPAFSSEQRAQLLSSLKPPEEAR